MGRSAGPAAAPGRLQAPAEPRTGRGSPAYPKAAGDLHASELLAGSRPEFLPIG